MFNAYSMRAVYDASKIVAPVLIVRGNADSTSSECDARGLLRSLGSRNKRYETVSPGSHFVCFERACSQLLDVCEDFLEECSRERLGDDSSRSGS
jgi:pimeloyl-ACP methyl ester carboxylesterase